MDQQDHNAPYSAAITVAASPERAYAALTAEIDQWWTRAAKGDLAAIGNRVRVDFPPQESFWVLEAVELIENKRVHAKCVEAFHIMLDHPDADRDEWLETEMVWDISPTETGSVIEMTHTGLTPELACFDVCRNGWDFFFASSLQKLLNGEEPEPHPA